MKKIVILIAFLTEILLGAGKEPVSMKIYDFLPYSPITKKIEIKNLPPKQGEADIKWIMFPKTLNYSVKIKLKGPFRNKKELESYAYYSILSAESVKLSKVFIVILIATLLALTLNDNKKNEKLIFAFSFTLSGLLIIYLLGFGLFNKIHIMKIYNYATKGEYSYRIRFSFKNNPFLTIVSDDPLLLSRYKEKVMREEFYVMPQNVAIETESLKKYNVFTDADKIILRKNCLIILKEKNPAIKKIKTITEPLNKTCESRQILKDPLLYPVPKDENLTLVIIKFNP